MAFEHFAAALAADLDEPGIGRESELLPFGQQVLQAPLAAETGGDGGLHDDPRGEEPQRPEELGGAFVAAEIIPGDQRVRLQDGEQFRAVAAELVRRFDETGPAEVGERPIFIRESGNDDYSNWVKAASVPAP